MAKNQIQNFEIAIEPEGAQMNSQLRIAPTSLESSTRKEEHKEAPQQQGEQTPAKVDINEMGGNAERRDVVEVAPASEDINC